MEPAVSSFSYQRRMAEFNQWISAITAVYGHDTYELLVKEEVYVCVGLWVQSHI